MNNEFDLEPEGLEFEDFNEDFDEDFEDFDDFDEFEPEEVVMRTAVLSKKNMVL